MPRAIPSLADTETDPQDDSQLQAVEQLVIAAENRLDESGHAQRVGELSAMLALEIGLPEAEARLIRQAAPMHDIGIVGIPDQILAKPGRLTSSEFARMRRHVHIGARMLSHGTSEVLAMARLIARSHHERLDGSGYPKRLRGDRIPLPGQIVALTDFFDTLTRRRPYRRAFSADEALGKVEERSGSKFDPMLVSAFMRSLDASQQRLRDAERAVLGFRLQGTVDTNTLFDLLVSFDNNGRSGRLGINVGYSEATLFIEAGHLVHAEYGAETGEAAVAKLLLDAGRYASLDFTLEPWSAAEGPDSGVRLPLARLLITSTVAVDEMLAAAG